MEAKYPNRRVRKMMNKKVFFTLIAVILPASISFAQVPSPLKDIKVSATATLDSTTGIYTYNYSIYNPPINDGQISSFDIDISKPTDGQKLNSAGLIIQRWVKADGAILSRSFDEEIVRLRKILEKQVIPVGSRPPLGLPFPAWSADITVMGTAGWGGSDQNRILPNQTLGGFILTSYGLPGIRDIIVRPSYIATKEDLFKTGVSEEEYIEKTWEVLDKFYKSISFQGKTIGPTAPPAGFKPIPFLDHIISLKHEAYNLGWIKNAGIEQSLDAKLDNAKKKIEQGNIEAAKNILNAFINEVEAQGCTTYEDCSSGKHISPEGYALLKYNVQYLISKL